LTALTDNHENALVRGELGPHVHQGPDRSGVDEGDCIEVEREQSAALFQEPVDLPEESLRCSAAMMAPQVRLMSRLGSSTPLDMLPSTTVPASAPATKKIQMRKSASTRSRSTAGTHRGR
jgi:hypothetical protein